MPIPQLNEADRPLLRQATLANMNWSGPKFTFDDVDGSDEISGRSLYERAGFEAVGRHGGSDTMLVQLQ